MYLHSISINNVSCFSSKTSQQTTWMEFDTDDLTSNINILIWPNNSWKSQFLHILQIIWNFFETTERPVSEFNWPQIVSSVRKTTSQEQHLISWLPAYIDIEFDFTTKSVYSSRTKLTQEQLQQLLGQHTTKLHPQSTHINPDIISFCNDWLWNDYLCDSIQSWWVTHIRRIMQLCTECVDWWIVLIDEPEAHLHPQLQQKLGAILDEISRTFHIQFFLSTHSPHFINQSNCINVFRFYQSEHWNTRHNPWWFIGTESSLQQILTQNNMSKIFFSKQILLCEWDIDQIFLHRFLVHYQEINQLKPYEIEIDFLPIAWKGSYDMRSRFCRRRKIDASFIWDRDNLFETNLWNELQYAKNSYNQTIVWKKLSKSDWYNWLIEWIWRNNAKLTEQIIAKIEKLQENNTHILKFGDIESYMWIKTKWIESTLHFCKHHFETRAKNLEFRHKYAELMEIFDQLIKKN